MNTVEVKKIWDEIKQELQKEIPPTTFDTWISHLEAYTFEDDNFTLISGESFGVKYIRENYR